MNFDPHMSFRALARNLRSYWPLIFMLCMVGILFFLSLGKESLWDWDECIYAQYGKEMRATGNWLTNQWNGLLGFEKPPMYAWFLQLPYLFKINEVTSRVLSIIFSLSLLTFVYVFGKKFFSERIAIISTFLMLTAEVLVIYFIRVSTDIPYVLFIFIGFYCWIISLRKKNASYLSGIFFGFAVMVKGLGVLPYMLAIFISIFFNFKTEKLHNFFRLLISFSIIILPWHIYQYIAHGKQFVKIYLYENLIQRANNPIEFHHGGLLFYVKLLHKELFPWIYAALILPITYLINIKKYLTKKNIIKEIQDKELLFTILLLIIIPFVSITRFQTKLPWYAIPIYPFFVIYLSYSLDLLIKRFNKNWIFYLLLILISIDAFQLISHETHLYQRSYSLTPRNAALQEAKKYPQKELYYLVSFSERRARDILAPKDTTSTTFVYGGNPCSVFYSDKKVFYYYSPADFVKKLTTNSHKLYFIENGDLHYIENLPAKILYKNTDFTLFEH